MLEQILSLSLPFVAHRGTIVWLQVSTEGKYRLNNLIKELSQGIPGFFSVYAKTIFFFCFVDICVDS